ncbi:MAG TPA: hypothetical protein V6C76_14240 [Drouetiella sp.]
MKFSGGKLWLVCALLLSTAHPLLAATPHSFEIKNASKFFDIKILVESCEDGFCKGKASFSFYTKDAKTPYQVINLPDTQIDLTDGKPSVNDTLLYDKQSAINIADFNFDGMDDVAICTGGNGSYGMPSYNVYLSSKAKGKFVYSRDFSELGTHLGMFQVNKTKKTLTTFDKSGCCEHYTDEYDVVANRPRKIMSIEEDATIPDETKVKVTTKRLVKGHWKTKVVYEKRQS